MLPSLTTFSTQPLTNLLTTETTTKTTTLKYIGPRSLQSVRTTKTRETGWKTTSDILEFREDHNAKNRDSLRQPEAEIRYPSRTSICSQVRGSHHRLRGRQAGICDINHREGPLNYPHAKFGPKIRTRSRRRRGVKTTSGLEGSDVFEP